MTQSVLHGEADGPIPGRRPRLREPPREAPVCRRSARKGFLLRHPTWAAAGEAASPAGHAYVVEGDVEFLLGDRIVIATAGDFVNVPRGELHRFQNAGSTPARLILTFCPAGIEKFFEETLERAKDPDQLPPDNVEEVAARYAEAAPRYGIEFLT